MASWAGSDWGLTCPWGIVAEQGQGQGLLRIDTYRLCNETWLVWVDGLITGGMPAAALPDAAGPTRGNCALDAVFRWCQREAAVCRR